MYLFKWTINASILPYRDLKCCLARHLTDCFRTAILVLVVEVITWINEGEWKASWKELECIYQTLTRSMVCASDFAQTKSLSSASNLKSLGVNVDRGSVTVSIHLTDRFTYLEMKYSQASATQVSNWVSMRLQEHMICRCRHRSLATVSHLIWKWLAHLFDVFFVDVDHSFVTQKITERLFFSPPLLPEPKDAGPKDITRSESGSHFNNVWFDSIVFQSRSDGIQHWTIVVVVGFVSWSFRKQWWTHLRCSTAKNEDAYGPNY